MTLPIGFRVRVAQDVVAADGGRLLVGGSPLTAMRLSDRALSLLNGPRLTVTDEASGALAERLLATNLGVPDLAHLRGTHPDDLTVVIPVRDRPEQLHRALAGLVPLQCVVVDDASHDPAAVAEVARRHGAELVSLPVNVGPAAARNAGLAGVRTRLVAFVDSDVEVCATDLLLLGRHFADPTVALVGPLVTGVSRTTHPSWFERYDEVASSLSLGRRPGSVRPGAAVAWLPSACLVGRTAALGEGFDPQLRVGEDVDLVWRLVADGHRVRYDPSISANHDARSTLRSWLGRKAYYGSGGAVLAQRHGDLIAPAVLTPTYAAAAAALLLRHPCSLPAAALALADGTRRVRHALPPGRDRTTTAARIALQGLGWALRQESALLLRHWWPAAAVAAIGSPQLRRALATALVADVVVAIIEHRHPDDKQNPALIAVGRRLDDLAYGAGLWWGAARTRSITPLRPRRPGSR